MTPFAADREPGVLTRALDSDIWHSFTRSPAVMVAAALTLLLVVAAMFAPWVAPHDPTDLAKLDLLDARTPPLWLEGGDPRFVFGTDNQGRDMLSAILYGLQISIGVSVLAVMLAMTIGVTAGLVAGGRLCTVPGPASMASPQGSRRATATTAAKTHRHRP